MLRQIDILGLAEYEGSPKDLLPEVPSKMQTMWQKYFFESDSRLCGRESRRSFRGIEAPTRKKGGSRLGRFDVKLENLPLFNLYEKMERGRESNICRHKNGYHLRAKLFTTFAHTVCRYSFDFGD